MHARSSFVPVATALIAAALGCADARGSGPEPVRVAVAASLAEVAGDAAAAFEAAHGVRVELNVAGSNTLARQIEAAPRAEVFVSADERWVDFLDERGRTASGTRRSLWTNELVVVGRADTDLVVTGPADLADERVEHLVLADPDGVPAGRYARAWLEAAGVWEDVRGRVAPALDVRAALGMALADRRALAIVYATDAGSSDARVVFEVPAGAHPDIVYCGVLVARSPGPRAEARAFLDFLVGPGGRELAARRGFRPLEP